MDAPPPLGRSRFTPRYRRYVTSLRHFPSRFLRQFPDLLYQDLLRRRIEESRAAGVEAAGFVAAFAESASGGEVTEDVIAVGGEPELIRPERLFQERDVVHHDLAGETDQSHLAAELPDGERAGVVRGQLLALVEECEHGRHSQ